LVAGLKSRGYWVGVETNGTYPLPPGLDWITVSPKPQILLQELNFRQKQKDVDEVKVVLAEKQYPHWSLEELKAVFGKVKAYLISPASAETKIDPGALQWCIKFVKENPEWRLTLQLHKIWRIP